MSIINVFNENKQIFKQTENLFNYNKDLPKANE